MLKPGADLMDCHGIEMAEGCGRLLVDICLNAKSLEAGERSVGLSIAALEAYFPAPMPPQHNSPGPELPTTSNPPSDENLFMPSNSGSATIDFSVKTRPSDNHASIQKQTAGFTYEANKSPSKCSRVEGVTGTPGLAVESDGSGPQSRSESSLNHAVAESIINSSEVDRDSWKRLLDGENGPADDADDDSSTPTATLPVAPAPVVARRSSHYKDWAAAHIVTNKNKDVDRTKTLQSPTKGLKSALESHKKREFADQYKIKRTEPHSMVSKKRSKKDKESKDTKAALNKERAKKLAAQFNRVSREQPHLDQNSRRSVEGEDAILVPPPLIVASRAPPPANENSRPRLAEELQVHDRRMLTHPFMIYDNIKCQASMGTFRPIEAIHSNEPLLDHNDPLQLFANLTSKVSKALYQFDPETQQKMLDAPEEPRFLHRQAFRKYEVPPWHEKQKGGKGGGYRKEEKAWTPEQMQKYREDLIRRQLTDFEKQKMEQINSLPTNKYFSAQTVFHVYAFCLQDCYAALPMKRHDIFRGTISRFKCSRIGATAFARHIYRSRSERPIIAPDGIARVSENLFVAQIPSEDDYRDMHNMAAVGSGNPPMNRDSYPNLVGCLQAGVDNGRVAQQPPSRFMTGASATAIGAEGSGGYEHQQSSSVRISLATELGSSFAERRVTANTYQPDAVLPNGVPNGNGQFIGQSNLGGVPNRLNQYDSFDERFYTGVDYRGIESLPDQQPGSKPGKSGRGRGRGTATRARPLSRGSGRGRGMGRGTGANSTECNTKRRVSFDSNADHVEVINLDSGGERFGSGGVDERNISRVSSNFVNPNDLKLESNLARNRNPGFDNGEEVYSASSGGPVRFSFPKNSSNSRLDTVGPCAAKKSKVSIPKLGHTSAPPPDAIIPTSSPLPNQAALDYSLPRQNASPNVFPAGSANFDLDDAASRQLYYDREFIGKVMSEVREASRAKSTSNNSGGLSREGSAVNLSSNSDIYGRSNATTNNRVPISGVRRPSGADTLEFPCDDMDLSSPNSVLPTNMNGGGQQMDSNARLNQSFPAMSGGQFQQSYPGGYGNMMGNGMLGNQQVSMGNMVPDGNSYAPSLGSHQSNIPNNNFASSDSSISKSSSSQYNSGSGLGSEGRLAYQNTNDWASPGMGMSSQQQLHNQRQQQNMMAQRQLQMQQQLQQNVGNYGSSSMANHRVGNDVLMNNGGPTFYDKYGAAPIGDMMVPQQQQHNQRGAVMMGNNIGANQYGTPFPSGGLPQHNQMQQQYNMTVGGNALPRQGGVGIGRGRDLAGGLGSNYYQTQQPQAYFAPSSAEFIDMQRGNSGLMDCGMVAPGGRSGANNMYTESGYCQPQQQSHRGSTLSPDFIPPLPIADPPAIGSPPPFPPSHCPP